MNRIFRTNWLACSAVVILSGCSILKPREDPSRYYRLSSVALEREGAALAKLQGDVSISVGPTTLPAYLDRQGVVSLISKNELSIAEFDLWSEGLDEGIARVLAENLRIYLGTGNVMPFPKVSTSSYDYRVPIFISRFERNTEGQVELLASWSVMDSPGSEETAAMENAKIRVDVEKGVLAEEGGAADERVSGQVEAMSRALDELSRKIARSVVARSGQ